MDGGIRPWLRPQARALDGSSRRPNKKTIDMSIKSTLLALSAAAALLAAIFVGVTAVKALPIDVSLMLALMPVIRRPG
jgi:hypothetical protein